MLDFPITSLRDAALLLSCRACGRSTQRVLLCLVGEPHRALTLGEYVDRPRCRFQPRPNKPSCGAAPSWVAIERGGERTVLRGEPAEPVTF